MDIFEGNELLQVCITSALVYFTLFLLFTMCHTGDTGFWILNCVFKYFNSIFMYLKWFFMYSLLHLSFTKSCSVCDYSVLKRNRLKLQRFVHSVGNALNCPQCGYKIKQKLLKIIHSRTKMERNIYKKQRGILNAKPNFPFRNLCFNVLMYVLCYNFIVVINRELSQRGLSQPITQSHPQIHPLHYRSLTFS